jgi:hypothetical protein
MESLSYYINQCKKNFNKRQYEQFINPLMMKMEELFDTKLKNDRKDIINAIYTNMKIKVNQLKESTQEGYDIIDVADLLSIIDNEKSKLL